MSLPKYSELYLPFLTTIQDGAVYSAKEVRDRLASSLRLSDDDLSQLISSNHQTVWASRFGWANTYLKKAGLVIAPEIGHCQITDEGQRLLRSGVDITNNYLMEHYPDFAAFGKGKRMTSILLGRRKMMPRKLRRRLLSASIRSSTSGWRMTYSPLL